MMGTDHDARRVDLADAFNLRDLGGLPTTDGRVTLRGRLFRSEYPGFVEGPATDAIARLGLRTVVDLRRRSELRHESVDWAAAGVVHVHCSLRMDRNDSWRAGYHSYLTAGPEVFLRAVRALADPAGQPALVHCAAGKDRTGVVSAVLLSLLGVEPEAIAADYALTERGLARVLERLARQAPYTEMLLDYDLADHTPRSETMTAFLDWLERTHGGAEAWLLGQGLSPEEIAAFRAVMLAPTTSGRPER
jgi:protein-tyrosine phosphatase